VFRSSLRPIGRGIRALIQPGFGRERPPALAALTLLFGLLPALPASLQAAPLPAVPPGPAEVVPPGVAVPVPPPPLGAAALLGTEPLSLGGDAFRAAPPPLLMVPAALEGVGTPSPGPAATANPPVLPAAITPTPLGTTPSPAAPNPTPGIAGPERPKDRALVLDRQRRLLSLWENGRVVRRFTVAVGMPGWETPAGRFQVLNKTENPIWEHPQKGTQTAAGPANPLGSRWIGFHQDCQGRRGWDGEHMLDVKGCVVAGFHGTPHRWTVGQALSHGCVRLYDEDVRQVFDFVSIGTPVTVLP